VDKAFDYEYSTKDRVSGILPSGPMLVYPRWLQDEDFGQTISSVESCVRIVVSDYPRSSELDWKKLTILIHDNLDYCVARFKDRVSGFNDYDKIVITWRKDSEGYPRETKPFQDLISHEMFHWTFLRLYGDGDRYHSKYFPSVMDIIHKSINSALPIKLSEKSRIQAKSFEYKPWTESLK